MRLITGILLHAVNVGLLGPCVGPMEQLPTLPSWYSSLCFRSPSNYVSCTSAQAGASLLNKHKLCLSCTDASGYKLVSAPVITEVSVC